jgi:hypothetical protein
MGMRAIALAALILLSACGGGAVPSNPTQSSPKASPSPVAECRLPVTWGGASPGHAFMSYPGGELTQAADAKGDVYDATYQRWVPGPRELVSPDGSQYAYWSFSNPNYQVHVVDVASGLDRVVYDGATNYWPIAFADRIYLEHAINLRQNSAEGLRLDPAGGGTPVRVPGSELRPQARWTVVGGGSAWGLNNIGGNQQITNTVVQLDLATSTITEWLHEPENLQLSPIGLDDQGRLYISDNYQLWRLDSPNVEERLLNPPPVAGQVTMYIFASDAHGEWMGGYGGVWHYSDAAGARQVSAASNQVLVAPAGPCL